MAIAGLLVLAAVVLLWLGLADASTAQLIGSIAASSFAAIVLVPVARGSTDPDLSTAGGRGAATANRRHAAGDPGATAGVDHNDEPPVVSPPAPGSDVGRSDGADHSDDQARSAIRTIT